MSRPDDKDALAYLGIAALFACVFIADYFTRLGLAEWIFYVLPIGMCLFQRHPAAPIGAALLATVLIVIGFLVSPQGTAAELAAINRTMGVTTIWFSAFIVRQTLLTRASVLRL